MGLVLEKKIIFLVFYNFEWDYNAFFFCICFSCVVVFSLVFFSHIYAEK